MLKVMNLKIKFIGYPFNNNNNLPIANSSPSDSSACCSFCHDKGHKTFWDFAGFKNISPDKRLKFISTERRCWRCLDWEHRARFCLRTDIPACENRLHCEMVCNFDYRGCKFVSGALCVQCA